MCICVWWLGGRGTVGCVQESIVARRGQKRMLHLLELELQATIVGESSSGDLQVEYMLLNTESSLQPLFFL